MQSRHQEELESVAEERGVEKTPNIRHRHDEMTGCLDP